MPTTSQVAFRPPSRTLWARLWLTLCFALVACLGPLPPVPPSASLSFTLQSKDDNADNAEENAEDPAAAAADKGKGKANEAPAAKQRKKEEYDLLDSDDEDLGRKRLTVAGERPRPKVMPCRGAVAWAPSLLP